VIESDYLLILSWGRSFMKRIAFARRFLSIGLAVAMIVPAISAAAEAAVGTWLSPKPGQRIDARNVEVSVGYNTESSVKVTRLELWIDGRFYDKKVLVNPETRGVCSFWWDTTRTSQGTHDLEVRIFAGNEMIATVSGTGTIGQPGYDLRPPSVRFTNIKSGDVLSGTARIAMAASDDSGEPPIVSLLVDSTLKLLTNRAPYVCDLDTKQYSDGSHELQSIAYDSAGNKSDPAIVKVAFKNNQERPVVTTMSVNPAPRTVAPSEDDGAGELLPPVAPVGAEPVTIAAARSAEPGLAVGVSTPAARPTAVVSKPSSRIAASAAVEPTARPVEVRSAAAAAQPRIAAATSSPSGLRDAAVAAPVPEVGSEPVEPASCPVVPRVTKPAAAARAVGPNPSSVPRESPELRTSGEKLALAPRSHEPAMPSGPVDKPRESWTSAVASSEPPASRSTAIRVEVSPGSVVEPGSVPAATKTEVVVSDVGSLPVPQVSTAKEVRAAVTPTAVREDVARVSPSGNVVAPAAAFVGKATPASPVPVRVAMLPSVRVAGRSLDAQREIGNRPAAPRETRAKIEKRTLPASGKVRLRDLFGEIGGVLFWDPLTRTVTGYAKGLKMEMQIGGSSVIVNGQRVKISLAPVIVDGRTVIDAGVLRQVLGHAGVDQALVGD